MLHALLNKSFMRAFTIVSLALWLTCRLQELPYPRNHSACSVGWFVSLLVRLREREVLLAGSGEQYLCEGAGQLS